MRWTELAKMAIIFFLILPLSYSFPVLSAPNLVIFNKDTPDKEYAKIIMDKYYLKRKVEILDDNKVYILERKVKYIPILGNNISIERDNCNLYIEYEINDGKFRYKEITCTFKIINNSEVDLLGTKYKILSKSNGKLVLYTLSEKFATNHYLNYSDYTVELKLISTDYKELIVDVYKNGSLIKKDLRLIKDRIYHLEDIALLYEGINRNEYIITVYNITTLETNREFILNKNFTISLSNDKIILIHRDPASINGSFNIFNYHINIINDTSFKYFKITYINNYTVELEDTNTIDLGEGVFLIKNNSEILIFKDGKIYNKTLEEYYTPNVLLDSENLLKADCNIILVGGPKANKLTRNISKYLKMSITGEFPGKNKGIIQIIENPYNPNYYITVVAGSDRWGTKACVMALIDGVYRKNGIILVEWINNTYRILS